MTSEPTTAESVPLDLKDPSLYFNREISLLKFHQRVLEEAQDESVPLLERIKFLAIVSNNLDEFFMTRVAGLWEQRRAGVVDVPADGMTPQEQLDIIRRICLKLMQQQRQILHEELMPRLKTYGIRVLAVNDLSTKQRKAVSKYFVEELFPVLTPLGVDPGRPFPFISNLSLNIAVLLATPDGDRRFARIKVPTGVLPRLVTLRAVMEYLDRDFTGVENTFLYLEDIIASNLGLLFPGMEIIEYSYFRVTRNADVDIAEEEASDLLETIDSAVQQRRFGVVMRLSVDETMSRILRTHLMENMNLDPTLIYDMPSPLGMSDFFMLFAKADVPMLKDPSFVPRRPAGLELGSDVFSVLRERDILLHHPYDSFMPVVEFIEAAAHDPQVLAIKCTLYRLGSNSPIVHALLEARQNGKQVAALVELKARFDEENNIGWAKALEAEGVHVIYGFQGLKTHSKIAMVVRAERDGLRRYVHLATGNYNPSTARLYTDIGLLTSRADIGNDATQLFNRLTGFAPQAQYNTLLIAPEYLRDTFVRLIEREIEHAKAGKRGRLVFKMNQLVDARMIRLLYEASQVGVKISLIVRGICCLKPGIPGISDNIEVISIVGRFLEHSRVYYFYNDGKEEIYTGSADMMPRNLDRRVETIFPIQSEGIKLEIRDVILKKQLEDNVKARLLQPDGTYLRKQPSENDPVIDSQVWFIEQAKNPF